MKIKWFLITILLVIPLLVLAISKTIPNKEYVVLPPQYHFKHLDLIHRLIQCESGGKNVKHLDRNNKYSYGILQIQQDTWNQWAREFKFIGSPMNTADARIMTDLAIDKGYGPAWTCWKILKLKR